MKKTLQNLLAVSILFIGVTANSQTRYLDDVFTDVKVTDSVVYAQNISIEPMLSGLNPA